MKFYIKVITILCVALLFMIGVVFGFTSLSQSAMINSYDNVYVSQVSSITQILNSSLKDTNRTISDYETSLLDLPTYSFTDIVILTKDGSVLASTSPEYKDAYINTLSYKAKTLFLKSDGGMYELGENLFIFSSFNDFSKERIMVVIPSVARKELLSVNTLYQILAAFLLIIIACASGVLIMYFYKHRFDLLHKVNPVNTFLLKVKPNGLIMDSDKIFKENFENTNLSHCLVDKSLLFANELMQGKPLLIALTDKKEREHKLLFSVTSSIDGYKLLGSDMTSSVDKFFDLCHCELINPDTKFWNKTQLKIDWRKFLEKENYSSGLAVFFKIVNQNYYRMLLGEGNIPKILSAYAEMLRNTVKVNGEFYTLDSETTMLLITDIHSRDSFIKGLNELSQKINKPIYVDEQLIKLDIRIGIIPTNTVTKSTELYMLMTCGKKALKLASQSANLTYYHYRVANFEIIKRDLTFKEGVQELLRSGEIDVWFQPQFDFVDNKIFGLEALCRIVGERSNEISIPDFVEAAEQTGQIIELGKFIYEKAMDFAKIIKNQNVTVSINLSPIQLMQSGFVDNFLKAYNERELVSGSVAVEIIESTFIYSIQDVIEKLNILKSNGIAAHIDDFGIAYSSMYYLKRMPVDTLKIDKSFIDDLNDQDTDIAIVKNIIQMSKDLGLNCIAEGVETTKQVDILKNLGCRLLQGYWFSQALPKEKVFSLIKETNEK